MESIANAQDVAAIWFIIVFGAALVSEGRYWIKRK